MKFGKKALIRWFGARALVAGAVLTAGTGGLAQDLALESAGARFGFYDDGAGGDFHQAEAFVDWDLPWDWAFGSRWFLQTRLDASLGWLGESSADAAIVSIGPNLLLGRDGFPLSFEAGVSPTVLSRSDFPAKDFGIPFQFTSHAGLNLEVTSHIRISYRFQHMSNAGLGLHNPGLNLHMFGLSYRF